MGSKEALYRRIAADLADRIHRGDLPPGSRLPPERVLATQLGVNRSTVAAAYAELEAAGLVERRQGSGTVVRGDLWGVAPDWPRYLAGGTFQPTLPLLQRIRAARGAPGIVDLSEGTIHPELMPRELIQSALARVDPGAALSYPDPRGSPRLRAVLAERLRTRRGVLADPDSILITSGSQQALYFLCSALLSQGDAIAIEQPSYYYSLALFQSAGIRLFPLPTDGQGLDPGGIRTLYQRHRIRLVLLNPTFQNPTGTVLSPERREELLAICRSLGLPVVEDDAYGLLALDGPAPPALKALDREGRVIYVGTLSKHGGPGLRLGWVVGPRPVIDRLADVKLQIDFGTSGLVQDLAVEMLASPARDQRLAWLRRALRERRDLLMAEVTRAFGTAVAFSPPSGGIYLWGRWDGPGDDRQRLEAAIRAGVVVAPGRLYGMADGWLRLTYARPTLEEIRLGVARLAAAFRSLRGLPGPPAEASAAGRPGPGAG